MKNDWVEEMNQAGQGSETSSLEDMVFMRETSSDWVAEGIEAPDLICLSHLRWDFVYQRPQHLLTRCARQRRVFFVEEPIFGEGVARLELSQRDGGVWVVVPHLPTGINEDSVEAIQRGLLNYLLVEQDIREYILWYYTPMALSFTQHLTPRAIVYDCMDELSAFKNAPPILREREAELFKLADLVFTGGQSLYEAKRHQHQRITAFPSSVDVPHFAQARACVQEPADQAAIPGPRLGFFGVIDERMNLDLLAGVAQARPDWHLVMIGPVVKIDPADLPKLPNIHYLGGKNYKELPAYLSGWDVALLPFALNDSTRFISPTKTPEYLAAGRPVVSTSIHDVVRPYGEMGLVRIADTVDEFVAAVAATFEDDAVARQSKADEFLAQMSWDKTWLRMSRKIQDVLAQSARSANLNGQTRSGQAGLGNYTNRQATFTAAKEFANAD